MLSKKSLGDTRQQQGLSLGFTAYSLCLLFLFFSSCEFSIDENYTPLHSITHSTYTENGIDYLQFTLSFPFQEVGITSLKIYNPKGEAVEYVYEGNNHTKVYKGIVKELGTWKFKFSGISTRVVEDKEKESTFDTETLVVVD